MRRIPALLAAALILGGCTSGAAPGADDVVDQVEKAEDLEKQVEERNAEFESTP